MNSIDLNGKRILLVEDEAAVAMFVEDMLAEIGCDLVGRASRMSEAVARTADTDYDAALLDVNLDGVHSFDLARRLAADGKRFAFVTGYGRGILPNDLQSAPVLQKPFGLSDLENVLNAALE